MISSIVNPNTTSFIIVNIQNVKNLDSTRTSNTFKFYTLTSDDKVIDQILVGLTVKPTIPNVIVLEGAYPTSLQTGQMANISIYFTQNDKFW